MSDWRRLQKLIDITFHDLSLLQQAFVHSSYVNENPDAPLPDNERLEFLGDALLGYITAEKLYHEFPHLAEGDLTEIRTSLIRHETLAEIASLLDLGNYLYLSNGEDSTGGRQRQTNLADALEALIGAIYLDQGLDITRNFILSKFDNQIRKAKDEGIRQNYKSLLQEVTQAKYKQLPVYHLVEASGPDHDKDFIVEVALEDRIVGTGSGKSKRAAEMEAARSAWKKLSRR